MCLCALLAAEMLTLPEPVRVEVQGYYHEHEAWLAGVLETGQQQGTLHFTGAASIAAQTLLATLEGAMLAARTYGQRERYLQIGHYCSNSIGKRVNFLPLNYLLVGQREDNHDQRIIPTFVKTTARAQALRNLYLIRAAFSALWVTAMFLVGTLTPAIGAWLLVIYPAWDAVATLIELRLQADTRVQFAQYLNLASSVLATIAFGIALYSDLPTQITIFGIWALVAGLLQLVVGLARRRQLSGQWAIIASGAQSSVAGVAFILMAHYDEHGASRPSWILSCGRGLLSNLAIRLTLRSSSE